MDGQTEKPIQSPLNEQEPKKFDIRSATRERVEGRIMNFLNKAFGNPLIDALVAITKAIKNGKSIDIRQPLNKQLQAQLHDGKKFPQLSDFLKKSITAAQQTLESGNTGTPANVENDIDCLLKSFDSQRRGVQWTGELGEPKRALDRLEQTYSKLSESEKKFFLKDINIRLGNAETEYKAKDDGRGKLVFGTQYYSISPEGPRADPLPERVYRDIELVVDSHTGLSNFIKTGTSSDSHQSTAGDAALKRLSNFYDSLGENDKQILRKKLNDAYSSASVPFKAEERDDRLIVGKKK